MLMNPIPRLQAFLGDADVSWKIKCLLQLVNILLENQLIDEDINFKNIHSS